MSLPRSRMKGPVVPSSPTQSNQFTIGSMFFMVLTLGFLVAALK